MKELRHLRRAFILYHTWPITTGNMAQGGTSGHIQKIKEIYVDCDNHTVLFRVEQVGGAACHTCFESCFHKRVAPNGKVTIEAGKMFDPKKEYKK
jgi:phosphoribosyl-AMP cyclohydrolase